MKARQVGALVGLVAGIAAFGLALMLAACGDTTSPPVVSPTVAVSPSPTVPPDTTEAVCDLFREVAVGAFGETMSFGQVVDGLTEIGALGETARDPAISTLAVQAGDEGNARAMITGKPNRTQDALASACNSEVPL